MPVQAGRLRNTRSTLGVVTQQLQNWSGNYTFSAKAYHAPTTVAEVQSLVSSSERIKVLGARHSFNGIADSAVDLLSLDALDAITNVDQSNQTVTIGAGVRFGPLCAYLHGEGYALPNMASLPHISVAGAYATATHGSGDHNPILAASLSALDLVTADGELLHMSRAADPTYFDAVGVGLGSLGVVTSLTLDVIPTFDVAQYAYEGLSFEAMEMHFDEIMASAYSVSLFTDWQQPVFNAVWCKTRVGDPTIHDGEASLFGAIAAQHDLHPLPGTNAMSCTPQLGVRGPWHERLPHFRMEFQPSRGDELQSEYLLPRPHAASALRSLQSIQPRIADVVLVNEVRTVAADNAWMSPFHDRDSVAFHFTWKLDWTAVRELLPLVEACLAPFEPRPHWGKLFTMDRAVVRQQYRRLSEFQELARGHDPSAKFSNAFLDTYVLRPD